MMPIELTLVRPLVFTSTVVGWEIFVPWRPRRLCPLIYAAGHRREGVTLHQDWQKKSHSMVGIHILVPIFIIQAAVDEKKIP